MPAGPRAARAQLGRPTRKNLPNRPKLRGPAAPVRNGPPRRAREGSPRLVPPRLLPLSPGPAPESSAREGANPSPPPRRPVPPRSVRRTRGEGGCQGAHAGGASRRGGRCAGPAAAPGPLSPSRTGRRGWPGRCRRGAGTGRPP